MCSNRPRVARTPVANSPRVDTPQPLNDRNLSLDGCLQRVCQDSDTYGPWEKNFWS
jgi:hypothetical protein